MSTALEIITYLYPQWHIHAVLNWSTIYFLLFIITSMMPHNQMLLYWTEILSPDVVKMKTFKWYDPMAPILQQSYFQYFNSQIKTNCWGRITQLICQEEVLPATSHIYNQSVQCQAWKKCCVFVSSFVIFFLQIIHEHLTSMIFNLISCRKCQ